MATLRTCAAATALALAAAILPAPAAHAGILDNLLGLSSDTDYHATDTTHTIPMSATTTIPMAGTTDTTQTTIDDDIDAPLISTPDSTPDNPWPTDQYATISHDIARIINAHRAAKGEPVMRLDNTMSAAAQTWASEMAHTHWFEHDPGNTRHGEIIAWRNNITSPSTAENFVQQWEHSPAHARLMHRSDFHVMGVGVANDPKTNQVYAVVRLYFN